MRRAALRLLASAPVAPWSAAVGTRAAATQSAQSVGSVRAAAVRGLAKSFERSLKQHEPGEPIDMALATQQHDTYTALLRRLVPHVIEVPADPAHPDCCFIEDTVVVVPGGVAVLTRPGALERRGEVEGVAKVLQRLAAESSSSSDGGCTPLIRAVHSIKAPALLDGGDVLQIAGHLLVGLSARTNEAAVEQLRALLAGPSSGDGGGSGGLRVESLQVAHGLHLKSACSALDDSTLLLSDNEAGRSVAASISSLLPELAARLSFVTLPGDPVAANVLRVGEAVVMQGGPRRPRPCCARFARPGVCSCMFCRE